MYSLFVALVGAHHPVKKGIGFAGIGIARFGELDVGQPVHAGDFILHGALGVLSHCGPHVLIDTAALQEHVTQMAEGGALSFLYGNAVVLFSLGIVLFDVDALIVHDAHFQRVLFLNILWCLGKVPEKFSGIVGLNVVVHEQFLSLPVVFERRTAEILGTFEAGGILLQEGNAGGTEGFLHILSGGIDVIFLSLLFILDGGIQISGINLGQVKRGLRNAVASFGGSGEVRDFLFQTFLDTVAVPVHQSQKIISFLVVVFGSPGEIFHSLLIVLRKMFPLIVEAAGVVLGVGMPQIGSFDNEFNAFCGILGGNAGLVQIDGAQHIGGIAVAAGGRLLQERLTFPKILLHALDAVDVADGQFVNGVLIVSGDFASEYVRLDVTKLPRCQERLFRFNLLGLVFFRHYCHDA